METATRREYYPFTQFAADVGKIANVIRASKRPFTKIYGPPRGGLPLAVCLSHQLKLELLVKSPFDLVSPDRSTPLLDTSDFYYKNLNAITASVLIVDDIADTGRTLKPFKDAGFFIATLYKHPQSAVDPDVWIHAKGDDWIEFWWEHEELLLDHQRI